MSSQALQRLFRIKNYFSAAIGNPRLAQQMAGRLLDRKKRAWRGNLRPTSDIGSTDAQLGSVDELVSTLSSGMGVLLLGQDATTVKLGVADVNLSLVVRYLRDRCVNVSITSDGKRSRSRGLLLFVRLMNANTVCVTGDLSTGDSVRIVVESYERRAHRHWVSRNLKNVVARALYSDLLLEPGLHEIGDVLGGVTQDQLFEKTAIDLVYTWVNHDDPDWKEAYRNAIGNPQPADGPKTDAEALSRFHNNDELRYSLRSIAQNLNWVNKIFIVSNCAAPGWLDTEHPMIKWIDHAEIIPDEYLPTFSSHTIESYLHKIPDLSEHFLYANDDFFVCKKLDRFKFFTASGISRSFLEPYAMVTGGVVEGGPDYLNASRNSAKEMVDHCGVVPVQLHKHVPYALKKSVLARIEETFGPAFERTRQTPFRRGCDVNVTSFLYHHYALFHGEAINAGANEVLVKSGDLRWKDGLKRASGKACEFLCINEGGVEDAPDRWYTEVAKFLAERFPNKAPWENTR